jgi:hypothetical protein
VLPLSVWKCIDKINLLTGCIFAPGISRLKIFGVYMLRSLKKILITMVGVGSMSCVPSHMNSSSVVKASKGHSVKLNVPYYCQMNNRYEKTATCSNSSLAMVLEYHGKKSLGLSGKLPDQLYAKYGKLNSVDKISQTAKRLGFTTEKRVPSSFSQIKSSLDQSRPVIIGGDFVGSMGHFVVAIGYNEKGFIIHDPYGHWDEKTISPNDGYGQYLCNRGYTGSAKTYSYSAMKRAAGSGFWTVTLKK